MRINHLIFTFMLFFTVQASWQMVCARSLAKGRFLCVDTRFLAQEESVNLYCLKSTYPQIENFEYKPEGIYIRLKNKIIVPYTENHKFEQPYLKTSFDRFYPLEPERVVPPKGYSPGRNRPYYFFNALYGANPGEIKKSLRTVKFMGKSVQLTAQAARAFQEAAVKLEKYAAANRDNASLLKLDGGYYWRNIAGENKLSAHAYGIAIDLGAARAPYWRWAKKMPHPMQFSYPSEIVEAMEEKGFVWGGKWHEYDLMHFEYRPELVCKSRMSKLITR